jgi:hypothetical protein
MRLLALAIVALLPASAASQTTPVPVRDTPVFNPNQGQPESCPPTSRYDASRRGKSLRPQKLNELPDADVYSAVWRHIGGCEIPIIVKYGVRGQ